MQGHTRQHVENNVVLYCMGFLREGFKGGFGFTV